VNLILIPIPILVLIFVLIPSLVLVFVLIPGLVLIRFCKRYALLLCPALHLRTVLSLNLRALLFRVCSIYLLLILIAFLLRHQLLAIDAAILMNAVLRACPILRLVHRPIHCSGAILHPVSVRLRPAHSSAG
jgi:hypothetical protein